MIYPTLPCIENKCLKYPACLSKVNIKCDVLTIYMSRHTPFLPEERMKEMTSASEAFYDALNAFIDHVRNALPNLTSYSQRNRII